MAFPLKAEGGLCVRAGEPANPMYSSSHAIFAPEFSVTLMITLRRPCACEKHGYEAYMQRAQHHAIWLLQHISDATPLNRNMIST